MVIMTKMGWQTYVNGFLGKRTIVKIIVIMFYSEVDDSVSIKVREPKFASADDCFGTPLGREHFNTTVTINHNVEWTIQRGILL
jgi:hypothetical protein